MIYICGDSFCASDPEYPEITPWHEQIYNVTNLGRVCASNLLIAQQVNKAIQSDADFIIVEFTSSLRSELLWKGEVVPFSWLSLDDTTPFDDETLTMLKQKFEYVDLNTEIERNKLIIEATLQRLVDSNIPFLFDQGGFEHPSYGGVGTYFNKYNQYRSKYCLWNYADNRTHRPYFHIQDQSIHNMIAEYYNNFIQGRQID
jgi:hypothetical protein